MGFRRFEDMVGRTDRLKMREAIEHWKARGVDLSAILYNGELSDDKPRRHSELQEHGLDRSLDNELIEKCMPALERGEHVRFEQNVLNTHRTVGGMLSGELARRYGNDGLPDGTIRIDMHGVGGQSFGAWLAKGLTFTLEGTTNDYVGKGLSGGRLAVFPSRVAGYKAARNVVVGNVALYGATAGEAYFRGFAGERFAVRNSGAHAVVEGVGDHGCEYMTGGVVAVLGETGRNFAAGMSGGVAFVLDEEGRFETLCNKDMVGLEAIEVEEDEALLRGMVERHLEWTGSERARWVLKDWDALLPRFVKVMPHDLKRVLQERQEAELEVAR